MKSPHRPSSFHVAALLAASLTALSAPAARADSTYTYPYQGVTCITRTETTATFGRNVTMHIALIDLTNPGISFGVTSSSGVAGYETVRQTTADFVTQSNAQLGINVAFFDPNTTPSNYSPNVNVAGLIVSQGNFVSNFDDQPCHNTPPVAAGPTQSYAIVPFAPALNIDSTNHATIVHRDSSYTDNQHILETTTSLFNAVSGSAQIITDGTVTIPVYKDASNPNGLLSTGTSGTYSNSNSWYDVLNARTAIGITGDGKTLVLFTVDKATESNGVASGGMKGSEVANILLNDYKCYEALNLDGGGSTCMALQNPGTGKVSNVSAGNDGNYPQGRPEGVNLAIFATPVPEPASLAVLALGGLALIARRRKVRASC